MKLFSFEFGQSCWRPRYVYKVSFGVSAVRDDTSNSSRVHCMFYQGPLNPLDTPKCQILHLLCSPPSQCCLCQLIIGPSCLLFDFIWTRLRCSLPLVHLFDMTLLFLVSVFSQRILPQCMSGQSFYSFPVVFHPFVSSFYRDSSSLCPPQILGRYCEQSPDSFVLCGLWQPGQARSTDAHNSPRWLFFARCDGSAGKPCLSLWCHSVCVEHEDVWRRSVWHFLTTTLKIVKE